MMKTDRENAIVSAFIEVINEVGLEEFKQLSMFASSSYEASSTAKVWRLNADRNMFNKVGVIPLIK